MIFFSVLLLQCNQQVQTCSCSFQMQFFLGKEIKPKDDVAFHSHSDESKWWLQLFRSTQRSIEYVNLCQEKALDWCTWLEMCRGWVPFQLCHSLSLWPWANYLTGSATAQFVRSASGSDAVSFLLSVCLLTILKFLERRHSVCVAAVPSPGTAQILMFITIAIVLGLQKSFTSLDQSTQWRCRNLLKCSNL